MKPVIDLFGVKIDSYILMLVVGSLLSFIYVYFMNRYYYKNKLPFKEIIFLSVFVLFGASLGARLLFFITMIPNIHSFQDVIKYLIKEGGLVFYGGLIGGFLFGILYIKLYGHDPNYFMELITPSIPLGHAIGRIGCFLAGCCYGKITSASYGIHFSSLNEGEYAIPVQLYEAGFLFLLWLFLFIYQMIKRNEKPYRLTGIYFFSYSIWRFFIEFFRGDEIRGIFLLSTSQWIALVMLIIGCFLLFGKIEKYAFFQKQKPWRKKQ